MSFVAREVDRIREAIALGQDEDGRLYAAQQALCWVLEPAPIMKPFEFVTGNEEETRDCSAHRRQPRS